MKDSILSRIKNKILSPFSTSEKDKTIEILEKKLRDVNQKFEIFTKATNDAVWDWDLLTNKIEWNHGLKTMFGYDEKENAHNYDSWASNIHPLDKEEVLNGINQSIKQGKQNWSAIYRYKCLNGSYKYTYDRGYIVFEYLKPVRMIGAMQDIDERMTTMTEVEKLSLVASKTENLVIITNAEEKIEWVNEGFVKRTGYSLTEMIGKTPGILNGPETDLAVIRRMNKRISDHESVTEEILNYTKGGSKLWLKLNVNPVFNDSNELIKLVMVGTDVTPHKEFENKITAIARELSDLIENANAVIFGMDRNFYVNEWNTCSQSLTGYSRNDVLGKKLPDFLAIPGQREIIQQSFKAVLEGNPLNLEEFFIISKTGVNMTLLISATPRRNSSGEVIGLLAVGQDITELTEYRQSLEEKVKERTAELKASVEKEKELADLKSRFVSIASHEFRTPISSISFAAESIRHYFHQLTAEEINRKLIKIEDLASHMTNLLEDVLVIGKSEAGKIKVHRISLDLKEFIDSLIDAVNVTIKEKRKINFVFSCKESKISADDKLLRNVIVNLLTNAIKYSPSDKPVTISVSDFNKNILLEVTDEGIGIEEQELDSVFESFQRGSNASTIPGTGLGLSIVKKAVELMNGSIEVKSKVNKGSTFTVRIPV